jgi:hypothetical protein
MMYGAQFAERTRILRFFTGFKPCVIPAKAGIQRYQCGANVMHMFIEAHRYTSWIPAFAGMTDTTM